MECRAEARGARALKGARGVHGTVKAGPRVSPSWPCERAVRPYARKATSTALAALASSSVRCSAGSRRLASSTQPRHSTICPRISRCRCSSEPGRRSRSSQLALTNSVDRRSASSSTASSLSPSVAPPDAVSVAAPASDAAMHSMPRSKALSASHSRSAGESQMASEPSSARRVATSFTSASSLVESSSAVTPLPLRRMRCIIRLRTDVTSLLFGGVASAGGCGGCSALGTLGAASSRLTKRSRIASTAWKYLCAMGHANASPSHARL